MAVLLFKLRNVPEDEANGVRELLAAHALAYYETSAGNWGISVAAIWLQDDDRLAEAKALVDEYQAERSRRVRAEFDQLAREGKRNSIFTVAAENPLRFVIYLAIIALVLYLSIMPFISLGQ